MEQIVHKVADNAETLGGAVGIAVCGEFASLEAAESASLFWVKVWAVGVEPGHGFLRDGVALWVINEREAAMRDEIWENEGSGFVFGSQETHGRQGVGL
jgi:hypothetical protein